MNFAHSDVDHDKIYNLDFVDRVTVVEVDGPAWVVKFHFPDGTWEIVTGEIDNHGVAQAFAVKYTRAVNLAELN